MSIRTLSVVMSCRNMPRKKITVISEEDERGEQN